MHDQVVKQEINSIFQSARIIPGKDKVKGFNLLLFTLYSLFLGVFKLCIHYMLGLELLNNVCGEFGRPEMFAELSSCRECKVMRLGNHAL